VKELHIYGGDLQPLSSTLWLPMSSFSNAADHRMVRETRFSCCSTKLDFISAKLWPQRFVANTKFKLSHFKIYAVILQCQYKLKLCNIEQKSCQSYNVQHQCRFGTQCTRVHAAYVVTFYRSVTSAWPISLHAVGLIWALITAAVGRPPYSFLDAQLRRSGSDVHDCSRLIL